MRQEEKTGPGQSGGGAHPARLAGEPALSASGSRPPSLVLTLVAVAILVAVQWFLLDYYTAAPPVVPGRHVVFRVAPGESLRTVARNLAAEGLVSRARQFESAAKSAGKAQSIRAGEYLLISGWSPERILEELTSTAGILLRVSVREGLSWWDTAQVVAESGAATAGDFRKAAFDPALLKRYEIPADSPEGYLFPETYQVTKVATDNARVLAEAMFKEFWKNARKVWPEGLPEPAKIQETVVLASLVEKESGDLSERERIAGVFVNRLRKGMRLQSDPTTIYGLGESFDGDLTRADLDNATNPYNTYKLNGLPPGPICSPGLVSLQAAAHPEQHDYLYFVAKGDGSHYFSKTLDEHNAAVVKYQLHRNRATYRSSPKQ